MRFASIAISGLFLASSASAMSVSTFLEKANGLKARGPLALLSSDYTLLKNEIRGSMDSLRAERLAAVKSGRPPAYCPTGEGGSMTVDEILGAMNAVPAPARSRMDVRDALRAHMAQRFPCKA